jgi:hypothetical protein
MIQEEKSIFWEVIGQFIVRKEVRMNMRIILNGYRGTGVRTYKYKSIVNGNKEGEITYC